MPSLGCRPARTPLSAFHSRPATDPKPEAPGRPAEVNEGPRGNGQCAPFLRTPLMRHGRGARCGARLGLSDNGAVCLRRLEGVLEAVA